MKNNEHEKDIDGINTPADIYAKQWKHHQYMPAKCGFIAGQAYAIHLKVVTEEKKNTMENMTKEQAAIKWLLDTLRPFENMEALGPLECFKIREIESLIRETTASGSVAAPKEDERDALIKAQSDYIDFLSAAIAQPVSFLHTHNWNYSEEDIEKGKKLRKVIERARKLLSK